ncbi:MAG: FMN-binding negative transcriptional regulator [Gammaproteobacteria bacterium]|nr:FMN-binding negative transcriptional regulator [Gammaproteobacteria bacterium]
MSSYPPTYHTETDEQVLFAAIEAIQHATLVVPGIDGPDISFTPLLLDRQRRLLRGHVAGRNPQSDSLDGEMIDAVFHGPHTYISPQLNNLDDVPTWNYINVHVRGKVSLLDDEVDKWSMMQEFVHVFEGDNAEKYLEHYSARLKPMLKAITCFEMTLDKVVGRFKLGRNDSPELQQKTFTVLRGETPPSLRGWLETLAP